MLFDQKPRNYMGPGRYSECYYEYIDRSARKTYNYIRQFLNDWFSRFPAKHQNLLKSRLISSDNSEFLSAFFELYLHELLLRLGFEMEIHPRMKETSKRPDFLVNLKEKHNSILEASMTMGSHEEINAEKTKKRLYDKLNEIHSPNFFLTPTAKGKSNTTPPFGKWCRLLEKDLSKFDPDEIEAKLEAKGARTLPRCFLKHNGLSVTIMIEPKPRELRGKPGIRNIGFRIEESSARKVEVYIRKKIKEKAASYGKLNLPYVLAINVMHHFCFDSCIENALFGGKMTNGRLNLRKVSKPYGVWWGPRGPQNTRVSAILIFKQLFPWSIAQNTPVLWHNPWAKIPLNPDIFTLPQKLFNEKGIYKEHKAGKSAGEIFNLPPNWPEIE